MPVFNSASSLTLIEVKCPNWYSNLECTLMFKSLAWIIDAINQSESKLVKAITMLSTFLILVFGCIFNTNVCESRIDVSTECKEDPSKCPIGTFCYVPRMDCGFYPPSCHGICQPGCQKPEHCQSDETCFILPNFAYGYF